MLKKQNKLPTYNDGVAYFFRERGNKSAFGAKLNAESACDLNFVVKLGFSIQSIRERDYAFAEQRGFNVSMKIKTHYVGILDSDCKVLVDGLIYDVSYIDKTRTELFFYLDGGVPFGNA